MAPESQKPAKATPTKAAKATPTKKTTGQKAAAAKSPSKATKAGMAAKAGAGAPKPTSKVAASPGAAKAKSAGKPRPPAKAPTKAKAPDKAPAAKKASTSKTTGMTTAQAKKKAASATRSGYWAKAQRRARSLMRSKDKLLDVAKQGDKVAAKIKSGPMSRVIDQLKAMLRLIRAYATGEYTGVSWESMVLIVGALVYVVSPLDLIPDFIPVVGYLDDVTVVSFVLKIVGEELNEFKAWERRTGRAPKSRR